MTTLLAIAAILEARTELVLQGLDPIELVQGREVQGDPRFTATYLRHEYRFTSDAHRLRFQKSPVAFAVQNGGACGKMGELTGKGSPARWAVANGKIFLFASDGCRTTFLASKETYFAPLGVRPRATKEERAIAKSVYASARAAHGGTALQGLKQVQWVLETPYNDKGTDKVWRTNWAFLGRGKYANWEQWDQGRLFFVVSGKKASEGKPGETYGIHPGELRALDAVFTRHPVGILLGNGGEILKPLATGKGWVMAKGDIVFEVRLDEGSSRIQTVSYHDRAAGPVADVVVEYTDYADVNGVWLPRSSRSKVNDGDWSKPRIVAYQANGGVPQVFLDAGNGF